MFSVKPRVGDWVRPFDGSEDMGFRVTQTDSTFAHGADELGTTYYTDCLEVLRRPLRVGDRVTQADGSPVDFTFPARADEVDAVRFYGAKFWTHECGVAIDVEETRAEHERAEVVARKSSVAYFDPGAGALSGGWAANGASWGSHALPNNSIDFAMTRAPVSVFDFMTTSAGFTIARPGSVEHIKRAVEGVIAAVAPAGIRYEVEVATKSAGVVRVELTPMERETEARRWWASDDRVVAFIREKVDNRKRQRLVVQDDRTIGFTSRPTVEHVYDPPEYQEEAQRRYARAEQIAWDRDEPKVEVDGVMVGSRAHYEERASR